MASPLTPSLPLFKFKPPVLVLLFFPYFSLSSCTIPRRYTSIFSFGDSLADTGNSILSGAAPFPQIGRLPYGMTYFGHPSGRCSDGRLVVDFISEAFGLPLLPPYLARGQDLRRGANFAVAGATALDPAFFQERVEGKLWTNLSLNVQLGWFEELKPTLCVTTRDCDRYFNNSLFLLGEIGGNDYNFLFFSLRNKDQVRTYVPNIVEAIVTSAERLIKAGAVSLIVPGNLPIGCVSHYLTLFQSPNKEDYDRHGCLKQFNALARYHNAVLRSALQELRPRYPQARIIYFDYYGAAIRFVQFPGHSGFKHGTLRTCCGGGGPYNLNFTALCGQPGATVCKDPSSYVIWDGIHLTEAAYRSIAVDLLQGPFTNPPIHL